MTDLLPTKDRFVHHIANYGIRETGFAPDMPPLCEADFLENRESKPVRVLCLGMPRTGTMSLGAALGMLGYRTYNHIEACLVGRRDMKCWNEALDAKYFGSKGKRYGKDEFTKILRGFDAVGDGPAVPYFSEDLLEAFPDAKVILTQRPVDDWVTSISKTVAITFGWPSWRFIAWADKSTSHWHEEALKFEKLSHFSDAFSPDQRRLRAHYNDYYDQIRKICPPERLLEFKTGSSGFKELCEFLEVKEPGVPYPRINDSSTFVPMYSIWWWSVFRLAAFKVLTRGTIVFAAFWIVWRRRRLLPSFWRQLKDFVMY